MCAGTLTRAQAKTQPSKVLKWSIMADELPGELRGGGREGEVNVWCYLCLSARR